MCLSGLLEMFEAKGIVIKTGNKLEYTSPVTGEVIKEFRKQWTGERLQVIIDEWGQNPTAQDDVIDVGDVDPDEFDDITDEGVLDES